MIRKIACVVAIGIGLSIHSGVRASDADSYAQLALFGEVFDKILSNHADEPPPDVLGVAAIKAMIARSTNKARKSAAQSYLQDLQRPGTRSSNYEVLDAFGSAFDALHGAETDTGNARELVRAAIAGMLYAVGPQAGIHYGDSPPASGQAGGIGAEVTITDGHVQIITPVDGGAAALAALSPGDLIVAIDGNSTKDMPLDDAVALLRGEPGTAVSLTIRRPDRDSDFRATVLRTRYEAPALRKDIHGTVAYLRIPTFNDTSGEQLSRAVADLQAETGSPAEGLVVDLRNNPGGLLSAVSEVASAMLDGGEITSVRIRDHAADDRYVATPGDETNGQPIIVLINEGTAAGAELLAAALQDNRRAIIMGARSAGAGRVHHIVPFDGGALRLTAGYYHRPTGAKIEGSGVTPDIAVAAGPAGDAQLDAALKLIRTANRDAITAPVDIASIAESVEPSGEPAAVASLPSFSGDQTRVALVIGNSTYDHTPSLGNPANDAADIADALSDLGFSVQRHSDLTKSGMDDAFRTFARQARSADVALFYYAGHAMQFEGVNYLMPIDARLEDEVDVPYEMARVDDVIADMSRTPGVRIAILDSCRDNPLEARLKNRLASTRSVARTRGLARTAHPEGLIVAYATRAGSVAADGTGANSPFTAALLDHIATPGLEIGLLFRRVTRSVREATSGRQHPELSVSFDGEFYFNPG